MRIPERRVAFPTVLAILTGFVVASVSGQQTTAPVPKGMVVSSLLDAYGKGQFDAVGTRLRTSLSSKDALTRFVTDLERIAGQWPERVAAGFALEGAIAAFDTDIGLGARLLEAGCHRVRSVTHPGAWELAWQLAAVSVLQGPPQHGTHVMGYNNDWPGGRYPLGDALHRYGVLEQIRHAREQFPGEDQFRFSLGLTLEADLYGRSMSSAVYDEGPTKKIPSAVVDDTFLRWEEAEKAFRSVLEQTHDPFLQGQAALHLGSVEHLGGHREQALRIWSTVPGYSADPAVRYLAHLLSGRVLLELQRPREAGSEFVAALAIRPGTASAQVPLAAILFLSDQRSVAAQIVEEAIRRPTPENDPWWSYFRGDYGNLADRVAAVRVGIR
jgi:tetratricopeptide (TPR) repeat protein